MDNKVLYYEIMVYEVSEAPPEQASRNTDRNEVLDVRVPVLHWGKLLNLIAAGLSLPEINNAQP